MEKGSEIVSKCANCGETVQPGETYCPACGAVVHPRKGRKKLTAVTIVLLVLAWIFALVGACTLVVAVGGLIGPHDDLGLSIGLSLLVAGLFVSFVSAALFSSAAKVRRIAGSGGRN